MHRQLSRRREHAPLKTEAARREVVLAPAVTRLLREEEWLASSFKAPHHLIFCNTLGRGLDYRDVGEAFRATVKRSGITATGGSPSTRSATAAPRC